MAKKVAVVVVNPVNGSGLFQYLEAFYENGIPYKTFAVDNTTHVKTNSGISMQADDVIALLKGREDEYDALVFACGDAMITFRQNADKQFNQDLMAVIKNFNDKGKMLVGHCAAAILFDNYTAAKGKKVALHPVIKTVVKNSIGTDDPFVVDGSIYTAQTENAISLLIPDLLKALK